MNAHVTAENTVGSSVLSGRITRLDRGWSTVLLDNGEIVRVRNLGVEVAVGDFVNVSSDYERVEKVHPRTSALTRRSSFEGARGTRQIVASNIDVVFVVHAVNGAVSQRRLERELVLAFDSGATPVVVLTKIDTVSTEDAQAVCDSLAEVALGVDIVLVLSLIHI